MIGQKFTRLTVLAEVQKGRRHDRFFLCRCDCGKRTEVAGHKLKSGRIKSCGCWRLENATLHGCARDGKNTAAYKCWAGMKNRCNSRSNTAYRHYGGRGIKVCDRWMSFKAFLEDMGEPPPGGTIDRINNDGNYAPGNCRWLTMKGQANNKRQNLRVEFRGKTQTLGEWCDELGLKYNTILCRLRRGWLPEKALTEPVGVWWRQGHDG
jgi:hypothetical protein